MPLERINVYLGKDRIEWLEKQKKPMGAANISDVLRRIIDDYRVRRDKRKEGKPWKD